MKKFRNNKKGAWVKIQVEYKCSTRDDAVKVCRRLSRSTHRTNYHVRGRTLIAVEYIRQPDLSQAGRCESLRPCLINNQTNKKGDNHES